MAQSALERNWPALRTPTLYGHPVLTDSLLCLWKSRLINQVINTDTFYTPLSVPINGVWLFKISRFGGGGGKEYRLTTVVSSHFQIRFYGSVEDW